MDLATPAPMITQPEVSTREIPLSRGLVAVVDAADYDWLSEWKWCAARASSRREAWYAVRSRRADERPGSQTIFMHRVIVAAPSDQRVDHWDRNGLNNRRGNLRLCVPLENSRNVTPRASAASAFKGVFKRLEDKPSPWRARIWVNKRCIELGYFSSEVEAALAYNAAAALYFGPFAYLNPIGVEP